MDIEKVNIVLAIAAVIALVYCIWNRSQKKGDEEYFYYINDQKCKAATQKLCNQMKSGINDVFSTPGVTYDMMESCGGSSYPDVQDCYPEWSTIRGGTEKANIDLILKQVTNKMY